MKMKTLWTLTLVGLASLLGGCGLRGWIDGGDAVEVREVGRSQLCSAEGENARVRVFDSPAAVIDWQERSGIRLAEFKDLERGRHALIEMGQRHTGGFGIAVSREARIVGDRLQVYATFFAPRADSMRTQMISSPCVLVHLPEARYVGVEVYDQTGALRASTLQETGS
jgi:hypothetical protein